MESLRRLRFIWAMLCLTAAVLCAAVGVMGNPVVPAAWPWVIAALCGAFAFYCGTVFMAFNVLWVGLAALYYGSMVAFTDPTKLAEVMLIVFGGGWVLAAAVLWVLRPTLQRLRDRLSP